MFTELQFALRNQLFGPIKLRKGLPKIHLATSHSDRPDEHRYYTLLLTTALHLDPGLETHPPSHIIDIGCRNWSYISALAQSFRNAQLTGIELDGYRRYWNLYRRIDLAEAYATEIRKRGVQTQVISGDFRTASLPSMAGPTLFCLLFPFVSENPCRKWGLPTQYAHFESLIRHSLGLARFSKFPCTWLSAHQGEWEAEKAREVYQKLAIPIRETILEPSSWEGIWPSPYPCHLILSQTSGGK